MTANATYVTPILLPGFDSLHDTNGFTLGKAYRVVGMQGAYLLVRNDNGDGCVISADGSPSPHLKAYVQTPPGPPCSDEVCAGRFLITTEGEVAA